MLLHTLQAGLSDHCTKAALNCTFVQASNSQVPSVLREGSSIRNILSWVAVIQNHGQCIKQIHQNSTPNMLLYMKLIIYIMGVYILYRCYRLLATSLMKQSYIVV